MTSEPSPALGRPINTEARAEKRAQILNGAQKCFVNQGFHRATMASIAKEAKVNVASIYQYYDNKDAVVEALVDQVSSQEIAYLRAFHPEKYDYASLRAFVSPLYTNSAARDLAAVRSEILSEAARNPKISNYVTDRSAKVVDALADFVRRFQEAGDISSNIDADRAAADLAYFHEGIQTHIPLTPDHRPKLLEIHVAFITSRLGIRNPSEAS